MEILVASMYLSPVNFIDSLKFLLNNVYENSLPFELVLFFFVSRPLDLHLTLSLVQLKSYILICILTPDNDNEDSQKMLRHLELIDDEAAEYEVKMVKIDDPLMAKKYGHREPPGLGFFRQGNFIKYEGNSSLNIQYKNTLA